MSGVGDNLQAVRDALRADPGSLAEGLFGPHNKALSTRNTWRWGSKGSLAVEVHGPRKGLWFNHEGDEGSDPLGMIQYGRRCSFPDALRYARQHTGLPDEADDAPDDEDQDRRREQQEADRQARRAEREAAEAVELAAEQGRRVETAQQIAANTVPLAGTIGEYYLKQTRGIPPGPDGWPTSIRFHPRYQSLVAVATDADGAVQAVQQVYLTADGAKAPGTPERPTKRTNGVLKDGAVVRLPGPADGPLLLAEGPETGLAARSSSGHETWIGLGGMSKMTPPAGRRVIVCRDDDPRFSPADRKLTSVLAEWRRAGVDVVVATPWPSRRYDKSDLADTILADGPDAVWARIMAATKPSGSIARRVPVKEARRQVAAAVDGFFERLEAASAKRAEQWLAGVMPIEPDMFAHGVRVDTGVGKSAVARYRIATTLVAMRSRGDTRNIVLAVPTHALGDEQAAAFMALPAARAAGLTAALWRGRAAPDPAHPDYLNPLIAREDKTPMCGDMEAVRDAQALALSAQLAVCKRRVTMPDGSRETVTCPLFSRCSYQKQHGRTADLWIVSHDLLFHEKPAALGEVAAVVVDEGAWRRGLVGAEGDHLSISLDALEQDAGAGRLADLRRQLLDALRPMPDGPVRRSALRGTLLIADSAAEAFKLEYARRKEPLRPGQTRQERKDAMGLAEGNRTIGRLAMVWNAIRELLTPGGPDVSGWLALARESTKDGPMRVLRIKGRKHVTDGFKAPTLLLDALLPVDLVRPFWPGVELVADVQAAMPHQRIRQDVSRPYALSMLEPLTGRAKDRDDTENGGKEGARRANRLRDLRALLVREARRYAPGMVLVVMQQSVEKAMLDIKQPGMGPLPPNVVTAHHNNIAGRDEWRDVRALIVVGRTMPPPSGVERIAEALTGRATAAPMEWYERADAVREMADGGTIPAEADRHTDPLAELARWQIAEGEVVQIIGRPRGVNRTAANPVDVLVLGDEPLPMPVVEIVDPLDLETGTADHMLAAGGVVFENARHMASAYPHLWETHKAAARALERERSPPFSYRYTSIGEWGTPLAGGARLVRVAYQVAGSGQKPAAAWFDPALCPDAEEFLAERLDKLAWCRVEDEPPPDPPAPPPVEPTCAVDSDQAPGVKPCEDEPPPATEPDPSRLDSPGIVLPNRRGRPFPEMPERTASKAPPTTCDVPWLHPEVAAFVAPDGRLVVLCLHCGKQHRHSGLGHRLAHCDDPDGRGYVLRSAGPLPPRASGAPPVEATWRGAGDG